MAISLSLNSLPWRVQLGAFTGLAAIGIGVFWYMYANRCAPTSMRAGHR